MESEATLTQKLLIIVELARRIEVLKNILYYSNNSEFQKIAGHRSYFNISHFLSRFKELSTQQLLEISYKQLFQAKTEINRGEFLLSLRPEVLQNTQVVKQHNVTQDYSKIMNILITTICQKAIARDDLAIYVRSHLDWFRQTLKIFAGQIEMRHFLKILKEHKLTSFQLELFMNEFFKKEQTTSITDFCGVGTFISETLSEDSKISLPMSTLSCDSLILPTPYIYECFANYITTMVGFEQKISHQTQLFNQTYNESTFQDKIMALYRKALPKINPRFNHSFLSSEIYKVYQSKKSDLDLKQFTHLINELKLPQINDRKIKIFFTRNSKDGLMSINYLYNLLNDNRLCASVQKQIPSNNQTLQQLLVSHFTLSSNLEDIRQTIWLSERVELFQLFHAIDSHQEGEISIEDIEQFFLKNDLKNKTTQIYDAIVRLFGEENVSLRNFIIQFMITP